MAQLIVNDTFDTMGGTTSRRFDALMAETRRRAYAMALQLTGNPSEAEDLVQETYIKAWRGFASYQDDRSFLNWLLRILQRANLDLRRRDNPIRKADSLNSLVSPSDGEVQELQIVDTSPLPDKNFENAEELSEIGRALATLPEVYGQALLLCDVQEFSYSEIAEAQGTTVGTVRSRIHRGRRMLREILDGSSLSFSEKGC
ncbi:MAG: sigma-70 family RNA polymerase sigma factor [Armatimonadetes bacterium]|nr:sigma-70 family RNA polymerase sigma factor [Armatimonadota bacterium]